MGDSPAMGPRPIAENDDLGAFESGVIELDGWLKARAQSSEASGAARTFVYEKEGRIIGYYALTVGSVAHKVAPGRVRRNMPDPAPVAILARLAVDRAWQGRHIGSYLLQDAVMRTITASASLGIRAILIHAISEEAKAFYERYGFMASPIEPFTLISTISDLRKEFQP